jgi:Endosomal/lysosomal potassium channel TMEM175
VPDLQSGQQLRDTLPQIGGFALSFAVIGLFWTGHHRLFRHVKGLNWSLMLLNLLFLGCIAFLPYPTALLSAAGDQVPATIFYAAAIAAAGLAEAAVWLYAIHIRDLALPGTSPAVRRWVLLRSSRPRWCSCCRSRSQSSAPTWPSTCGCWSSSAGWRCAGWNRPTRSRRPPTRPAELGAPRSSGDEAPDTGSEEPHDWLSVIPRPPTPPSPRLGPVPPASLSGYPAVDPSSAHLRERPAELDGPGAYHSGCGGSSRTEEGR